jgi:hypothetical protein
MSVMSKPREGKSILYLEIATPLKRQLQLLAEADERSLTGEVVFALKEFVARHPAAADLPKPKKPKGGA